MDNSTRIRRSVGGKTQPMLVLIIAHRLAHLGFGLRPDAATSPHLANKMAVAEQRTKSGCRHLVAIEEALDVSKQRRHERRHKV